MIEFWFAAFVFHRIRHPSVALFVKLHDIRLADKTKPQRPHRNAVFNPNIPPRFTIRRINLVVHDSAFGREKVLTPYLLDVDQGTLTFAVHEMLQGGELD